LAMRAILRRFQVSKRPIEAIAQKRTIIPMKVSIQFCPTEHVLFGIV